MVRAKINTLPHSLVICASHKLNRVCCVAYSTYASTFARKDATVIPFKGDYHSRFNCKQRIPLDRNFTLNDIIYGFPGFQILPGCIFSNLVVIASLGIP